jgi:AcrR family transcriptional regulator
MNQPAPAAGDKARLILDAALRVFARHGVHGTAVPPIAEEAGVAVGTLYRYFDSKEALVNAVFRDTKSLLGRRLLDGLDPGASPRELFVTLWDRLADFAINEPEAFQFLEMQDHTRYLDTDSRRSENALLAPLNQMLVAGQQAGVFNASLRADVAIALFWGGVVGLFKAQRNGYLSLDNDDLDQAREACWRAFASPEGAE